MFWHVLTWCIFKRPGSLLCCLFRLCFVCRVWCEIWGDYNKSFLLVRVERTKIQWNVVRKHIMRCLLMWWPSDWIGWCEECKKMELLRQPFTNPLSTQTRMTLQGGSHKFKSRWSTHNVKTFFLHAHWCVMSGNIRWPGCCPITAVVRELTNLLPNSSDSFKFKD